MDNLKGTLNEEFNVSATTNGAVGYKTTGTKLVDLNFAVASLRSQTEKQITDKFVDAFYEDKLLAVKWLFYVSDVRGGVGERRLFRIILKYLASIHPQIAKAVLELVPTYSRWDNLLCLLTTDLAKDVVAIIKKQLNSDMENMNNKKPISLCAKWMPSANASSMNTKAYAKIIIKLLGVTERQYRKMLSKLRSYLKIVEKSMSKNEWGAIDYSAVPSRANLIYNPAFLRHDEQRRRNYLAKLEKGEVKINAGVLFPHDIVHNYFGNQRGYYAQMKPLDIALEQMWKALPDYVKGNGNTICVADGSGSMTSTIGKTNVSALDVANALSIYFAERCSGQFKDKYITFSMNPQLVDLSKGTSLRQRIEIARKYDECANTNIEAVFNLILTTAINNRMSQADMPTNILILSDMEFDSCAEANRSSSYGYSNAYSYGYRSKPDNRLFDVIAKNYAQHGYKLPRLVFWNINSKTGTIPVKQNDLGVALVSGFSPAIVKMVLSNKTDPFDCLLEQLNGERYQAVEDTVKNLI
jgi:hypothetical protein